MLRFVKRSAAHTSYDLSRSVCFLIESIKTIKLIALKVLEQLYGFKGTHVALGGSGHLVRLFQAADLTECNAVAGRADIAGVGKAQFSSRCRRAPGKAQGCLVAVALAPDRGCRLAATPVSIQAKRDRLPEIVR